MKVFDVMSRGVISLAPGESMRKAAFLMLQYGMNGFPVLDRGKLVGIITQGDFLRRMEIGTEQPRPRQIGHPVALGQLAEEYVHAHGRKIGEVMTRDVVTITPDADLEEAVHLMQKHHVKQIPVVGYDDGVIGLVCRPELLHAFIVGSPMTPPAPLTDEAIHDALVSTLDKAPWVPHGSVNAIVKDGRVDFMGVICDERQRVALRVAAENIPGVKEVHDRRLTLNPSAAQ
jgi:CBS domain-containing protein